MRNSSPSPTHINTYSHCNLVIQSHFPCASSITASHMEWWHKIRRNWISLSTRIKLRKPRIACGRGGGAVVELGGGCGGADGGLLKLRDDVQMCGYRDVEIMWNMLSISLQPQQIEEARRITTTKVKLPRRGFKQRRSISRLFFWTNHSP